MILSSFDFFSSCRTQCGKAKAKKIPKTYYQALDQYKKKLVSLYNHCNNSF